MKTKTRLTRKSTYIALLSWFLIGLGSTCAIAHTENPFSTHAEAGNYSTQIQTTGSLKGFDETDIYFPIAQNPTTTFPIALMLQGGLVDKRDYSNFATLVARYGFIVVVPNHEKKIVRSDKSITGLLVDVNLVNDILDFIQNENFNEKSPVYQRVDPEKMGLLGHSLGGFVGLSAIQELCIPQFCTDDFTRPKELMAGIFYGASFRDPVTRKFSTIDNRGIPIGLIAGDKDGVAMQADNQLINSQGTYEQIQDPPKILVVVGGTNHYGITNEDNLEREKIRPTLSQDTATETIARWSALFLRAHLLDDQQAIDYIYNTGDSQDENVTVVSSPETKLSFGWGIFVLGVGYTSYGAIALSLIDSKDFEV